MKKKMINEVVLEGRIFDHSLSLKTVQNKESENYGKEFIQGDIKIAIDEDGLNVIPVHYSYVTAETKSGGVNKTFFVLKSIIEKNPIWIEPSIGKDRAMKVSVKTAIALNDFYDREDNLVSAKRLEGGFVSEVSKLADEGKRCRFDVDMVLTNVKRIETDEEKNIDADYGVLKGIIFNFRNAMLPIEFIIKNPDGINFFEGLGVNSSNPYFSKMWGKIDCRTIISRIEEKSSFGPASVKEVKKETKEWIITGTKEEPYEFGEENTITMEDLQKAKQDREIYLADVKKKNDEYKAKKAEGSSAFSAVKPNGFSNFGAAANTTFEF